jgi:uncharacterized protein (TIGR03067 family)
MRSAFLAAWAATCLLALPAGADDQADKNLAEWQGTWRAVSFLTDGKPSTEEQLKNISLTVKGSQYEFRNGTFSERGQYRFDLAKMPRQLDIVVGEGKDKGKVYLVIYEIKGDQLSICLEKENKRRPGEFNGAAGTGCVLERWQRVSPASN